MDLARREWIVLHRDHERYEQLSLIIKLFAVGVCLLCWLFSLGITVSILFVLILWLQEGIWKTYQARIAARILTVEKLMTETASTANAYFQLYSAWGAARRGAVSLVAEYLLTALRPTVAYPYVLLVLMTLGSELL